MEKREVSIPWATGAGAGKLVWVRMKKSDLQKKSKHVGRFWLIFSGRLLRFSEILPGFYPDFARILQDFARIFTKSNF